MKFKFTVYKTNFDWKALLVWIIILLRGVIIMDIKQNILSLLATDISSYEINRQTGVTRQLVDKYRKTPETIGKLTLDNALALNQYWIELNINQDG